MNILIGRNPKEGKGKSKKVKVKETIGPTYTKEELGKIRDEIKENMISRGTGGWCR